MKVRNADHLHHKKLLRLEDKLYELDQEIYALNFFKSKICSNGLKASVRKINYFDSLKEYLDTCKDENEFIAYLDERSEELQQTRQDIVITLKNKAPLLVKKMYDQKTQNDLYYDAYDFNVSSLDCLYDYLQRETFEYHKEFDWVYDIRSSNHLRLRGDNRPKHSESRATDRNSRPESNIEEENTNQKSEEKNNNKAGDMLSVYSLEHSQVDIEIVENNNVKKKVTVRHTGTIMKNHQLGQNKLVYNDLKDVKKLISLDFSNSYVLNLTLELLIQRSNAFYLSKTRVILSAKLY